MKRNRNEEGWGLILLIGITAALALLAATLVMVLGNQEGATAAEKSHKNSVYYAEGALDSAVQYVKTQDMPTTAGDPAWMTQADLVSALSAAGLLPTGATITSFLVYDNSSPLRSVFYDANGDHMMWLELTLVYKNKTTRMRCLVSQITQNVVKSFPKAVVYSDTGIQLNGSSDVYAVESDGTTPYNPATHGGAYATTVMAGGSKNTAAGAQNFASTASADLAAPTSTAQSVNINVNGAVTGHTYAGTVIGGVGLLSDYFDQAAQADLGDEAQVGQTVPANAPTAPTSPLPSPSPATTFSSTEYTDLTSTTTTTAFTVTSARKTGTTSSGNLTISRTTARTYNFTDLYVRGNLSLTGPLTLNVSGFLYVGGTLAINNTGTGVTDTINGPVYVASTSSASSVAGNVTFNSGANFCNVYNLTLSNTATSVPQLYVKGNLSVSGNSTLTTSTGTYTGGALTVSGATTARTDQLGLLYIAGSSASSVAGTVTLNANSIYSANSLTLSNTPGTTTGLIYSNAGTLTFSGNTTVNCKPLVAQGNFTISGATSAVTDQLGQVWCGNGTCTWSGTASVKTTDYTNSNAPPAPMWIMILSRGGTFNDVYGDVWLTGNAGTSNVAWSVTGPTSGTACTIMCPLLSTTEKTEITGKVNFGTMANPMVYYMMCDNDNLYSNTFLLGDNSSSKPFLGTFYGLLVVMEATTQIYSNNASVPCIVGALFEGGPYVSGTTPTVYDITLYSSASVAYDQAIIDAVTDTAITTMTTTTQVVKGSWQQIAK